MSRQSKTERGMWTCGLLGSAALLLVLGWSPACDTYPTFKYTSSADCSAEDDYEFDPKSTFPFETTEDGSALWSPEGDPFCNGNDGGPPRSISMGVETIDDGPRCGSSKAALVFRAANCNDWGALFGFSNFGPRDESAYEGMSFWARSPGNTGKNLTIVMDDANTASADGSNCRVYDGGAPGQATASTMAPDGTLISGTTSEASQPDQCGNAYTMVVVLTGDWRFYTIPWSEFTQTAQPNRVPSAALTETGGVPGTGLLTSKIWNLILRVPKESRSELWIDNFGFYRKKGSASGVDAGPDAAQR
jgi:hypothetical protein